MVHLLQGSDASHGVTSSVIFGALGVALAAVAWVAMANYTSGPLFIGQLSGPIAFVSGCIALAKAGTPKRDRPGFLLGATAVLLAIAGTAFFLWVVTQADGANVSHVGRLGDLPLP
jgi:uncharacterized membrane protein HdeD (DUF308 family)